MLGCACVTNILTGCASISETGERARRSSNTIAFVDYCGSFRVRGQVRERIAGNSIVGAVVVFVDTGLGNPFGVQKQVALSDAGGKFDAEYTYCWNVEVDFPPKFLLDPDEVDARAVEGLYSHGLIQDVLTAKKQYFEIWIAKEGYLVERIEFDFGVLPQEESWDIVECGTVLLERKEMKSKRKELGTDHPFQGKRDSDS